MIGRLPPVLRFRGAAAAGLSYIQRMKLIIAISAMLAFCTPALADKIPLKDISAYLNSLTAAQSDFTQVNADGSIAMGKIFIQRPGRARFEYAPPDKSLVLASGGQVAVFDAKSNQEPAQYPLKRTPLNLILAQNIDLGRARMVVAHTADKNTTTVVAQDPEHPEYGSISLVFSADPIALRQWIITDDLGQQTTVILGDLAASGSYKPSTFSIQFEMAERGF